MDDEFAASRLPDLPNAGYSSPKQKATSDLVMFWLRMIERDRLHLLQIVVDGRAKWRRIAGKAWGLNSGGRAGAMTTELLDRVFDYMVLLAGTNPAQQLLGLMQMRKERFVDQYDFRLNRHAVGRRHLQSVMADLRKYGPR